MTTATLTDVITELKNLGLDAELLPATQRDPNFKTDAINVWDDPAGRYPVTTVWPPAPGVDGYGWSWGPNHQYGAHGDDDAATVAAKVSGSLDAIQKLDREG